jgi:FlaA1/EpsC-like NDP-sugar epimerase
MKRISSLLSKGIGSILRRRGWMMAIPAFALVYYSAYWLRFEGGISAAHIHKFWMTVGILTSLKTLAFALFGVFHGWNRYLTFHDLLRIVQATTVAFVIFAAMEFLTLPAYDVPRSVMVLDWAGTLVAVGALRAIGRLHVELPRLFPWIGGWRGVLIVGANDDGEALLRNLRCTGPGYRVVGFIATDPGVVGTRIGGVPVLGVLHQTCGIAVQRNVEEILVASGGLPGRQMRELMEECRSAELTVKVLPSIQQLIDGTIDFSPRRVCIEDLLRRDPISLDQERLNRWLNDRVLVVTGSAGSIGAEICRQLLQFRPQRLVLIDRWENGQFLLEQELRRRSTHTRSEICIADVGDHDRIDQLLARHRPDVIFHAAAYKHVPLMEANPGEALKNIVFTTQQLADLAIRYKVESFVMISTDKAVNPTSIMGTCKRVAELYCQSLTQSEGCRFVTVRFGNVLDSSGSVVPIFREQIARGGPVTVTHPDMRRYFMTIPEASQLVIQAGALGQGGEIFVLDMGQPVRIKDLAEDMIRLSGLLPGEDIAIEFTGLRPGEKLFEELLVDGEQHVATSHPKIMVAMSPVPNRNEMLRAVRRLTNLANAPAAFIVSELQRIVPEFRHSYPEQQVGQQAA